MKKTVWLLIDDRKGSAGQIRGVAQLLNCNQFEITEKNISYTSLAALPNWMRGTSLFGVEKSCRKEISHDFPDIVLSGSRRSAPVARWIKKESGGHTKIVQLLYPGMFGQGDFDLIFVPEHDRGKISGSNVRFTVGSPHRITEKSMLEARFHWSEVFAILPRPLTAVIIGGKIKGKGFTDEDARLFGQNIRAFHQFFGGALLLTDSRRTGTSGEKLILEALEGIPAYTYLQGDTKENPYMGYLACADRIIVSGDSVSMCCEACGTGKPVFVFSGRNWLTSKHQRFVKSLVKGGYATRLEDFNPDFRPQAVLNPAKEIAQAVEEL